MQIETIKKHPLFQNWSTKDLQELLLLFKVETFYPNEVIITEGGQGSSFYIIYYGSVKVYKTVNYEEKILAILSKDDCFGELSLIDGGLRSASVKSIDHCKLYVLSHIAFKTMLRYNFDSTLRVLEYLTNRVRSTNNNLINFFNNNAAHRLLNLINNIGKRQGNIVIIEQKITYKDLVNLSNSDMKVVHDLEKLGLLFMNANKKICLDIGKLYKEND